MVRQIYVIPWCIISTLLFTACKSENQKQSDSVYPDVLNEIIEINNDDLNSVTRLAAITNVGPVMVEFYADWCRPCKNMAPALDLLARNYPHIKLVKVNVDKNPELGKDIRSIPVIKLYKNGLLLATKTGMRTYQELIALVEQYFR